MISWRLLETSFEGRASRGHLRMTGCMYHGQARVVPMGAFVDMLVCSDGSYYVGSATGDDLWPRIAQHEAGTYPGYTFTRRPVRLVWSEQFDRITDAIAVQRKIKGWSRAKKEALVKGDWAVIQRLSKRRAGRVK